MLRKQIKVGEVGAEDAAGDDGDGSDDEVGGENGREAEGIALLGGLSGVAGETVGAEELAGSRPADAVDWAAVLDRQLAIEANEDQETFGEEKSDRRCFPCISSSSADGSESGGDGGRGSRPNTSSWSLPLGLLVFTLPCVALAPFYVSMYATSYDAVGAVLSAQGFFTLATYRAGYVSDQQWEGSRPCF